MKKEEIRNSELIPAGNYWVGDPCYAFSNNIKPSRWLDWLNDTYVDVDNRNALVILDGKADEMRIVASGTAHGDGNYRGSDGNYYSVDAGLLGVVHEDYAVKLNEGKKPFGMTLHNFPEPFRVFYGEETGTVHIGHIEIETDSSD